MHDIEGEPERVHVQKVYQLHSYDCYRNVTEPQANEYHTKSTHMYNTGTVGHAGLAKACCTQAGPAHIAGHVEMSWTDDSHLFWHALLVAPIEEMRV